MTPTKIHIANFLALCSLAYVAVSDFANAQPTIIDKADFPSAHVQTVQGLPPGRHPQIVYWFWRSNTWENGQCLQDVQRIATESPFNFALMSERLNSEFYNFERTHGLFEQTVREAHAKNLKVGLQLWEFPSKTRKILSQEDAMALVTEGEVVLDGEGHANYSVTSTEGRLDRPFCSEFLKAFAFRKTADGFYDPNSLRELDANAVKTVNAGSDNVTLAVDAPADLAGATVYILVAHYHQSPDLFNNVMWSLFEDAFKHYADIPFDGAALDEFGWMKVVSKRDHPFRDRIYGKAFSAEFSKRWGVPLEQSLFEMRYAPDNHPEVRMKAINHYFDLLREGPLRVEKKFYGMTKATFGANAFSGIHNTYHNSLESDDIWRSGLNYWTNPREYGQTDEDYLYPARMGILVAHSEPIMYDQYYGADLDAFLKKAFRDARYGCRINYHAWNDANKYGADLGSSAALADIRPVENKIRLLNHFDPAAPKLPLLIVFGMPAQLNWYPNKAARSTWDTSKLGIESKAKEIWNAGYPCALVPSDLIDLGQLKLDADNHPTLNGHRFEGILFLYPEYSKETTLAFFENYTAKGGRLMIEGNASRDFEGRDIADRYKKIAALATANRFDIKQLPSLGITPIALEDGAYMEDGSVVLADYTSWRTNQPKPFSIRLNGHQYDGNYIGVCALKAYQNGKIEKFACGGFSELKRDGKTVLSLPERQDVMVRSKNETDYQITIVQETQNK